MSAHLALVACLDEARSVHSITFKRAIMLWQQYQRQHGAPALPIVCYDDSADAAMAARVAPRIVAAGALAVVGHFASSAAAAAAPVYAQAGLPLLLPAATARALTRHASTYRVCDHDDAYVAALQAWCAGRRLHIGRVVHDGSVHGDSIARAVQVVQGTAATARSGWDSAVLFSGSCRSAINFLAEHDAQEGPLILTDDAHAGEIVAPALAHGGDVVVFALAPAPVGSVAGFLSAAHEEQFCAPPGTYFWETIAAIEIALASAGKGLARQTWQTVLGPLQFDAGREAGLSSFAAFRVGPQGLQEVAP